SSIQVEISYRRCYGRALLGTLEKLVEFLFQDLTVRLLSGNLFLKDLIPPGTRAFELFDFRGQVLNRERLFLDGMRDHRASLGIHREHRVAARTSDLEHAFCHRSIVIDQRVSSWISFRALSESVESL